MAIKGGKVGTIKKLKTSLKKSEGGGFLTRIPKDDSLIVRFLTEPEEWIEYFEHYNDKLKFFPCSDDCPGCDEGDKPSKKYLARALDRADNRVIPLVLAKSLVTSLMRKYEKYNTIVDRDYELTREGDGMDTQYDAIPEAPTPFKASRYVDEEPTDIVAILEKQLDTMNAANSNDDDDDDDAPRGKKSSRAGSTKDRGKRRPEPDDDDDDDDDDEDIRPVKKKSKAPVKSSKSASSKKPMKKKRP